MTDSFVTQCPHCETRFKVNYAQLSAARGVVRCGACLQVFNAARQLVEQNARQQSGAMQLPAPAGAVDTALVPAPEPLETPAVALPAPDDSAQAATLAAAPGEDYWHVSELDLDNLDLDEELARLEQREIQPAAAFRQPRMQPEPLLSARRDTPQSEHGEWIASLTNDDAGQHPQDHEEVISSRDDDFEEAPDISEPVKEARIEPSLTLPPVAPHENAPPVPLSPLDLDKPPSGRDTSLSALDDDEPAHDHDDPDYDLRGRSEPALRDKTLLDLTDDPLRLDWQQSKPRRGRTLLWAVLVLLALSGLAGQYISYHFDHLARQDQYRPWFQQLCPSLGCKVPSKVDINQLKSSNLVVRSHPEFQGALVVDAIIYNRASFSQPFPLLELRFADTSGQLIASRRFKPGEYLSGEMAGKEEMPPQTPIHIALDILDPGAKAVNYSLNFRSPE